MPRGQYKPVPQPCPTCHGMFARLGKHLCVKKYCAQCGKEMTREDKGANFTKAKFCSNKCRGNRDRKTVEDFWSKIDKHHQSGCWIYRGACDRRGYGRPGTYSHTGENGTTYTKRFYAHRRSYELLVGPIPEGMLVLHKCDNPPCCNPAHLFLGTDATNAADKVAKRRHAWGEKNTKAKLTAEQVLEIRPLKGTISSYKLAEKYGVTDGAIAAIWAGRSWKHL